LAIFFGVTQKRDEKDISLECSGSKDIEKKGVSIASGKI